MTIFITYIHTHNIHMYIMSLYVCVSVGVE